MIHSILIRDHIDGRAWQAELWPILEGPGFILGRALFEADGQAIALPVVAFADGAVIQRSDWQEPALSDEELIEEAADPAWAHHWIGDAGQPCVILDGAPRMLG